MERTNRERQAVIVGVAEHAPAAGLEASWATLHVEAAINATEDAGVARDEIDGLLCVGSITDDGPLFLAEHLQDALGLSGLRMQLTLQLGGASHLTMLRVADRSIAAGDAQVVLCVSCGKFPPPGDIGRRLMSLVSHPDFELPFAPSIPGLYALAAQRWMHDTGATRADLAEVVAAQDAWAKRTPTALSATSPDVSVDDVLGSRMIAGPFGRLDCSIPCEGGGALVVAASRWARRARHRPVRLAAFAEAHSHGYMTSMPDLSRSTAAATGPVALERAGVSHADIDVLALYDAFSSNPLMLLEEIGFAPQGRAIELYREGRTHPDGELPVNTNGGLLRFGHCGTASGITGAIEVYRQVAGRADGRQVAGADVGLVHAYGGMLCSHVTLVLEGA